MKYQKAGISAVYATRAYVIVLARWIMTDPESQRLAGKMIFHFRYAYAYAYAYYFYCNSIICWQPSVVTDRFSRSHNALFARLFNVRYGNAISDRPTPIVEFRLSGFWRVGLGLNKQGVNEETEETSDIYACTLIFAYTVGPRTGT